MFNHVLMKLSNNVRSQQAGDSMLETHKFLVKRFAGLKDRIKDNKILLESGEPGLEIFKDTFEILYASLVPEQNHKIYNSN